MAMESYWHAVLHEVVNKNDASRMFRYTNAVSCSEVLDQLPLAAKSAKREKKAKFFVGESFPAVYFTQREFDCLLSLLRGGTVKEIAVELLLSPRTVEYYIKNLKTKMDCDSRSELLSRSLETELVKSALAKTG